MRFPMWRQLPDGSTVLVHSYDDIAKYPGSSSLPNKPVTVDDAPALEATEEAEPTVPAEAPKRGPGRPRKDS